MSLTIVGRTLLPHAFYCPSQHPDNLDKFFYVADGDVYSIEWGGDPVKVTDLGSLLTGKSISAMSVMAKNVSTVFGTLDETYHYVFYFYGILPSSLGIVDVNTNDGTYTVAYPFTDQGYTGMLVTGGIWAHYTIHAAGTMFYTGINYVRYGSNKISWGYKYYGQSDGHQSDLQDYSETSWKPVLINDAEEFLWIYMSGGGKYWRRVPMSTFQGSLFDEPIAILPNHDEDLIVDGVNVGTPSWWNDPDATIFPMVRRQWDDPWVYGFGRSTSQNYVLYFRKHLITNQYQVAFIPGAVVVLHNRNSQAFDIWQLGDDVSSRRIFFNHEGDDGYNRVLTSKAWPFAIDDSVVLDPDTGGPSTTKVVSIHTANEYVYAFHADGQWYGNCLTKIIESDLVAGTPEPSLGGIGARFLIKDKRVFFIKVPGYGKYLWWGQPMEPQSLDVGWDGFNTTVFDDEDNTSINVLDDNLYIGSRKGFIRLRGKSPDSWVLDQTLASTGPLSDKTSSVTPFGLIYPRENGLWLFNGFTSTLFFEKGKNLLANVNWDAYDRAFSLWDGRYYRLYYPSGTSERNDRELVIDLIGGIQNARGTEGDRVASCGFADLTSGTVYLGDYDGNLMTLGGTSALRTFSLTTREYPSSDLLNSGTFSALHYDIDLAGATLSIIPIYDGVEKVAINITNSTRTRGKVSLPDGNYYRIGFRFEVTTNADVKFYDPWYIV